jgi:hypothetical protein
VRLILACALAWASALSAQVPPAASPMSGTATIFGRVLDIDTMEPAPNELVLLMRPSGPTGGMPVVTDSQGRFFFARIWTGTSVLITAGGRRTVHLDEHQRLDDVTLLTQRMASISGRVVDDAGQPLPSRRMSAFNTLAINGRPNLEHFGFAVTDDRGHYTFPALVRGSYLICACDWNQGPIDPALLSLLGPAPPGGRYPTPLQVDTSLPVYPPTFYPAADRVSLAVPVSIASGEERLGIDVTVRAAPGRRVSGRVGGGPPGLRADGVRLRYTDANGPSPLSPLKPTRVNPDGRFQFEHVSAGEYIISVRLDDFGPAAEETGTGFTWLETAPATRPETPSRDQASWFANVPVTVADRDISDLQITVAPAPTLNGTLQFVTDQGNPRAIDAAITTRLILSSVFDAPGRGITTSVSATVNPDGSFEIGPIVPGAYGFRWTASTEGPWVKSVLAGSREITDMIIDVGAGGVSPLRVVMSSEPRAQLRGQVMVSGASDVMPTAIAVFPQERHLWNQLPASSRRFAFDFADQRGHFAVNGLPPGDYFVSAGTWNPTWAANGAMLPDFDKESAVARRVTLTSGMNPPIVIRR